MYAYIILYTSTGDYAVEMKRYVIVGCYSYIEAVETGLISVFIHIFTAC